MIFGALPAGATVYPDECQSTYGARGYSTGLAGGKSLIEQAWQGMDERCTRNHEPKTTVENALDVFTFPSDPGGSILDEYTACNATGRIDGIVTRLNELLSYCQAQCCHWGRETGGHHGHVYCIMSLVVQGLHDPGEWLRPPGWFCAQAYQDCCDEGLTNVAEEMCVEYTIYPYNISFHNVMQMTCAYPSRQQEPETASFKRNWGGKSDEDSCWMYGC